MTKALEVSIESTSDIKSTLIATIYNVKRDYNIYH